MKPVGEAQADRTYGDDGPKAPETEKQKGIRETRKLQLLQQFLLS